MKRIRKALCWLLCAVMLTGAVACSGEKSASGKISPDIEMQQEKPALSDGKHREKAVAAADCTTEEVVVENNLLSNKYGVENLDKKGLALYEKLKAAGIGSIDALQEQFVACAGNGDCERDTRNEYRKQEKIAGEKLVSLYKSGQLTQDEFNLVVTGYANTMLAGVKQGQLNSDWGGFLGDIYDQSGVDWTPMGLVGNPYFAAIKGSEQIAEWKSQGLSDDKISDLALKNNIINSALAPVDVNSIMNLLDNGASKGDVVKLAVGAVFNKVTNKTQTNNTGGKGSAIPVPKPIKANNGLIYKSNSKHTPGGEGNRPNAGIEPKNSLAIFESSVPLTIKGKEHKARYTMDGNGDVHRFSPDNTGGYHWSGSTADKKNKLVLPNDVRAALRKQEGWKIK